MRIEPLLNRRDALSSFRDLTLIAALHKSFFDHVLLAQHCGILFSNSATNRKAHTMDTAEITLTIPTSWFEGVAPTQDVLQHALKLGLDQLRQQDAHDSTKVIQALLRTGRVSHLTSPLDDTMDETTNTRQTPPVIEGTSVSDILIAQRKGEE